MNEGVLGILRLASVACQNIGFAVVVGALLSRQWLARGASTWQDRVGRHLLKTLQAASTVSLLATVLSFWTHCALMGDSSLLEAGPAVWSMLVETRFGHAWLIGAVLTLCIVMLSFLRSDSKGNEENESRWRLAMWIAVAGAGLARSHGGHPVDAGLFGFPVWIDWLHLLAVSAWAGLVLVTTYVVMPRLIDAPGSEMSTGASFVQSLSDAATYALIVLFGTGAYNGWKGVSTPANLIGSTYGQLLLLKLALVLIAAALGGHNRFFEMPKLMSALCNPMATTPARLLRRFGATLHVESVVLAGVLMVAALLVSSPLPGTT